MTQSAQLLKTTKKLTDKLILKFPEIVAVWFITPEEILNNDDVTLVALTDKNEKRITKFCRKESLDLRKTDSFKVHVSVENINDYFEEFMRGNKNAIRELQSSIPIYDPSGFFNPVNKLVKKGLLPGKFMGDKFERTYSHRLKKIKSLKKEAMEFLSSSVINAGQAALLSKGFPAPHQKMVDDDWRANFPESLNEANMIEFVFERYKEYEHGTKKDITLKELDVLCHKAKNVLKKAEEITLR